MCAISNGPAWVLLRGQKCYPYATQLSFRLCEGRHEPKPIPAALCFERLLSPSSVHQSRHSENALLLVDFDLPALERVRILHSCMLLAARCAINSWLNLFEQAAYRVPKHATRPTSQGILISPQTALNSTFRGCGNLSATRIRSGREAGVGPSHFLNSDLPA